MVEYSDDMTTPENGFGCKRKSSHQLNADLFINSCSTHQQDENNDENKRNKKKKKKMRSQSCSRVTEYIHVRARRGEATDSHSLAERVRREKISERMKYLQHLVPGCNNITGKAGMLDHIINYVQSLQRQLQFLSMKLATLNDFNLHHLFSKQVVGDEGCGPSLMMNNVVAAAAACVEQTVSSPSSGLLLDLIHLHNHHNMDINLINPNLTPNPSHLPLPTTINSIPQTFLHSSTFPQILPSSTWEYDFQDLSNLGFDQAPAPTFFSSFTFTGIDEVSNPKMELEM